MIKNLYIGLVEDSRIIYCQQLICAHVKCLKLFEYFNSFYCFPLISNLLFLSAWLRKVILSFWNYDHSGKYWIIHNFLVFPKKTCKLSLLIDNHCNAYLMPYDIFRIFPVILSFLVEKNYQVFIKNRGINDYLFS